MTELPEARLGDPTDAGNREIDRRNAPLRTEIRLVRGGVGNADAFRRALRESVLYVLPWNDDDLMCADQGGIRWVYAFTSALNVAAYALARGARPDVPVDYLTVRADRLLDEAVPALGVPAGLAIDIGSEQPMLVPALPEAVA
ncbi:hypothetical protein [Nocardioides sp. KR10-350]|uniref:hypothetical protein n=1 Tax=Nocardioides cheoyonin TaxID=3156615 RepID=UPI0032B371CA